jgi:hypothetical protein
MLTEYAVPRLFWTLSGTWLAGVATGSENVKTCYRPPYIITIWGHGLQALFFSDGAFDAPVLQGEARETIKSAETGGGVPGIVAESSPW